MSYANALELHMLNLVNQERAAAGLNGLSLETNLNASAEDHSEWMLENNIFSHTGLNNTSAKDRIVDAAFDLSGSWRVAENLAVQTERGEAGYFDDVTDLHISLMNSEGHRANILDSRLEYIGIGIEIGSFAYDVGVTGTSVIVTQNFGSTQGTVDLDDLQGGATQIVTPDVTVIEEAVPAPVDDTVALNGSSHSEVLNGTTDHEEIHGYNGNDTLNGGDGHDTLLGGSDDDKIWAGSGNDLVDGGADDDMLGGMNGFDTVLGGGGDDTIWGGGWSDTLEGGAGNDSVLGGNGNDFVLGDAGNDYLDGGLHADTLNGGEGQDTLLGGAGNDVVYGGNGDDYASGNVGYDEIWAGGGDDSVWGGGWSDTLGGGDGDDVLLGENGDDVLWGGNGADTLDGGAHADRLSGGSQSDVLRGGSGDDQLTGGWGNDTITGGTGADVFVFAENHGRDVITDFDVAQGDILRLDDGLWSGTLSAAEVEQTFGSVSGGMLTLDFEAGGTLVFEDITTLSGMIELF